MEKCPMCGYVEFNPNQKPLSDKMQRYVNRDNPNDIVCMNSDLKEITHKAKTEGGKDTVYIEEQVYLKLSQTSDKKAPTITEIKPPVTIIPASK